MTEYDVIVSKLISFLFYCCVFDIVHVFRTHITLNAFLCAIWGQIEGNTFSCFVIEQFYSLFYIVYWRQRDIICIQEKMFFDDRSSKQKYLWSSNFVIFMQTNQI